MLDLYAEQGEKAGSTKYSLSDARSMGQATNAGYRLVGRYHKLLVERALLDGKNVPERVLNDYPDLQLIYEMEGPEGLKDYVSPHNSNFHRRMI